MEEIWGVMTKLLKFGLALFTVKLAVPFTVEEVAVMVVLPAAMAVASPVASMEATKTFAELPFTDEVTSFVVPSENCPMAVKRCFAPAVTDTTEGLTVTAVNDATVGGFVWPGWFVDPDWFVLRAPLQETRNSREKSARVETKDFTGGSPRGRRLS